MVSVYIIVALFVMLFAGDSGELNSYECVLLGLFWPIVYVAVVIAGLCMCLVTDLKYAVDYIRGFRLKMKINKLIIDMVNDFNNKPDEYGTK